MALFLLKIPPTMPACLLKYNGIILMEEKMTSINVEVAKVTSDGFHMYTVEEMDALVARL